MRRQFRLKRSEEFKRVRSLGKVYAHPFFVLSVCPGTTEYSRAGIVVSKRYGNAVNRNLARRRLRSILNHKLNEISQPVDMVLVVRSQMEKARYNQLIQAVKGLLLKADLIKE